MRLAMFLPLLAGCQLVYPLETTSDDSLRFRRALIADSVALTSLTFERPPEIADTDLLIAIIHSPGMDETEVIAAPPELEFQDGGVASSCWDDWHTSFYAGFAGSATSYEFSFNMPDDHSGLITAYANASRASLLIHRDPDELMNDSVLPNNTAAPGSILWLGGGASLEWTDRETPSGMKKLQSARTLAAFELALPDGNVPEIDIDVPNDFCAGVAEIAIEP